MTEPDDLDQRLRAAFDAEPEAARRRDDLAAIHAAVDAARPRRWDWRHRAATLATAVVAITPVGLAVAAETSVPGDLLYPVKRAAESVRGVVDDDIRAVHRLDELQRLLDRDAPPSDLDPLLDEAARQVDRHDDPVLDARLVGLAIEASIRTGGSALADTPQTLDLPTAIPGARPHNPRPDRTPTPDAPRTSPTPRPRPDGPSPTPTPDDGPSPRPSPTRTPSPSPLPPDRPPPSPSPSPSPDPRPSPADRFERYEAGRAGFVTLRLLPNGIELAAVDPRDGWEWRANRQEEPRRVVVAFFHGDRTLVFDARVNDAGEVVVRVDERTRDGDH